MEGKKEENLNRPPDRPTFFPLPTHLNPFFLVVLLRMRMGKRINHLSQLLSLSIFFSQVCHSDGLTVGRSSFSNPPCRRQRVNRISTLSKDFSVCSRDVPPKAVCCISHANKRRSDGFVAMSAKLSNGSPCTIKTIFTIFYALFPPSPDLSLFLGKEWSQHLDFIKR